LKLEPATAHRARVGLTNRSDQLEPTTRACAPSAVDRKPRQIERLTEADGRNRQDRSNNPNRSEKPGSLHGSLSKIGGVVRRKRLQRS